MLTVASFNIEYTCTSVHILFMLGLGEQMCPFCVLSPVVNIVLLPFSELEY